MIIIIILVSKRRGEDTPCNCRGTQNSISNFSAWVLATQIKLNESMRNKRKPVIHLQFVRLVKFVNLNKQPQIEHQHFRV